MIPSRNLAITRESLPNSHSHSRESGNPAKPHLRRKESLARGRSQTWIPAFAGMTRGYRLGWLICLALLLSPLPAQACIDSVVETTPSFPADVQELVTHVTFCSALVRSLNEKGDENGADILYGRVCISDEMLEADILRVREAHKDSPEIQLLLNNLPPYKD